MLLALSQWGPTADWLMAAAIAAGAFLLLVLLRLLVRQRYSGLRETERIEFAELSLGVLPRTAGVFFVAVSAYLGLRFIELPVRASSVVNAAISIDVF